MYPQKYLWVVKIDGIFVISAPKHISWGSVNPNKPNGLSHPYRLGESICHLRGVRWFFFCFFFFIFVLFVIEIPVSEQ